MLGDVAKPDDGDFDTYVLVQRDSRDAPLTATSDAAGSLWLVFGTDSGFEGPTSLYYTDLAVELVEVPEPSTLLLGLLGLVGLLWAQRRHQSQTCTQQVSALRSPTFQVRRARDCSTRSRAQLPYGSGKGGLGSAA